MIIRQKILDIIDTPVKRTAIASILGVGEQSIDKHLRANKPNGRCTKMDFLQAVSEVSGFPVEEILEKEESVKEPQN